MRGAVADDMEVLLAQLAPVPGDPMANAARVADALAAQPAADLAVLPELFLSGYDLAHAPGLALDPKAPALELIGRAAGQAGTAALVGFAERGAGGAVHNSLAAIDDDGRLVSVYRKVQLFGGEREVFEAGDRLLVIPLAGHQVAPLLCFDMEFPEPARALAEAGADLLVTAAANMAPYFDDHELAARARALDNRLPHVYVNRVGVEAGLEFVGGSRVIGPDGAVQVQCPRDAASLTMATVGFPEPGDEAVEYLAQVPQRLPVHHIHAVPGGSR